MTTVTVPYEVCDLSRPSKNIRMDSRVEVPCARTPLGHPQLGVHVGWLALVSADCGLREEGEDGLITNTQKMTFSSKLTKLGGWQKRLVGVTQLHSRGDVVVVMMTFPSGSKVNKHVRHCATQHRPYAPFTVLLFIANPSSMSVAGSTTR